MGVVAGCLVVGLGLPFVIGRDDGSGTTVASASDGTTDGVSVGTQATTLGTSDDGGASASTGAPGASGRSATSGTSGAASSTGGSRAAAGDHGAASSERGVLADRIKLGFTIIDIASVGRVGGNAAIDPEQQEAAIQAYVDEVNDAGGIHGRRIEPFFRVYDILSNDDARAACLELADDKGVFAVVAGFAYPDALMCLTREKQVPVFHTLASNPEWTYEQSGGRLFTLYPRSHRMMEIFAGELDALGALRGKQLGILSDDASDPGAAVAKDLEQILVRRGHVVARRAQLPASLQGSASQAPIEVNAMQRAGVELVLVLTSTTVRGMHFAQAAESQRATWKYAVDDWASNYSDSAAENMPRSFDGAILITSTRQTEARDPNRTESPQATSCRKVYERRSGRQLAKWGSNEYALTMNVCDFVGWFTSAADAAGPGLTRPGIMAAFQRLGPVVSASLGDGTFGPGKFDMSDLVRTARWSFTCRCWQPADTFHPART